MFQALLHRLLLNEVNEVIPSLSFVSDLQWALSHLGNFQMNLSVQPVQIRQPDRITAVEALGPSALLFQPSLGTFHSVTSGAGHASRSLTGLAFTGADMPGTIFPNRCTNGYPEHGSGQTARSVGQSTG